MKYPLMLCLFGWLLRAQSAAVLAALATGTYFPLDVGDRWVYRIDNRVVTSSYETWRVDRIETVNGIAYSVIAIEGPGSSYFESLFRADSSGRIYTPSGTGEQLFLDPAGQSPGATLQPIGHGSAQSALGSFPDAINYVNNSGLDQETGTLARGLGLVSSHTTMLTGSSGGTVETRTLVEATVAGSIHFPAPSPALKLSMESLTLDVSGQKVTNCAVPCYFVACYLAPGADPPGTYKPCAQARVELANWPAGASRAVRLQLRPAEGRRRGEPEAAARAALFDETLSLDSAPSESVVFVQVPLYAAPNQPLPAGAYQLAAETADGTAETVLSVQIQ